MSLVIETVPEKKLIKSMTSVSLNPGQNIKIMVDGVIYDNLEYTVPVGKKAHLRIEIRGSIANE